jgi:hypothetical protein
MAQGDTLDAVWIVYTVHLPFGGWVACAAFVISSHEHEAQRRVLRAPAHEGMSRYAPGDRAMEQVAEKDNGLGVYAAHDCAQAQKIVGRGTGGHGYATFAEGRRFTEMCIGDQQSASARPIRRQLRQ